MISIDGVLSVAICDDEVLELNNTRLAVSRLLGECDAQISTFSEAKGLLFQIEAAGYLPDIAILDIDMPDLDGIETARALNRAVPECQIIFLTNYLNYATEVYDTNHTYFVIKSEMENRLASALMKARSKLENGDLYMLLKSGKTVSRLPIYEVIYLERELHKTIVATKNGTRYTAQTPAALLNCCGADNTFLRCHQSFWINVNAVVTMEANSFIMSDGTSIPISRARKDEARKSFFEFITSNN